VSIRNIDEKYYEELRPPTIFQYFLYGVIGLLAYLITIESIGAPRVIIAFAIGFVFLLSSIFGKLRIVITQSKLTVGFGFLKHSIDISNIDYVEVRDFPWYYGGFGVRFGLDWSVAYVQNYRRGVWVVPKRGRKLFFSSDRPEEIVRTLDEMLAHAL
jgi:hypothetical protein